MAQASEHVEIIVGTYEQFLLGYQLLQMSDDTYALEPTFSNHAHTNSVRCVAANDKILASGSIDETIQLFNMKTRSEVGNLQQHNGTITSLEFFDTFLFSSSEDGNICVWSIKKWQCEKTLSGHKGAVTDISIHPSGKIGLSISKDKTLRTWNLIKGRVAYVTNIKKDADFVQWTPNGHYFLIGCGNNIDVYSIETGGIIQSIKFQKRIYAVSFIDEKICAIGLDDGRIHLHDIVENKDIISFDAHSNRVKCLKSLSSDKDNMKWLFSASSDGYLKVWHINVTKVAESPHLTCEVNTTCRPTCLAVMNTGSSSS